MERQKYNFSPTKANLITLSLAILILSATAAHCTNVIPAVIYNFDINSLNKSGPGPVQEPAPVVEILQEEETNEENNENIEEPAQALEKESEVIYDQTGIENKEDTFDAVIEPEKEEVTEKAEEKEEEVRVIRIEDAQEETITDTAKDPDSMSAKEMVTALYENEDNTELKQLAIENTLLLTGGKKMDKKNYDGFISLGKWKMNTQFIPPNSIVVGSMDYYIINYTTDDSITTHLAVDRSTYNDGMKMQNKDELRELYKTVKSVAGETEGLSDSEKVSYFIHWINSNIGICQPSVGAPAHVLATGQGDCDGISNLFYLFAINSGMDCDVVTGYINGERHAWIKALIDGNWGYLDIVQRVYTPISEDELIARGYIIKK